MMSVHILLLQLSPQSCAVCITDCSSYLIISQTSCVQSSTSGVSPVSWAGMRLVLVVAVLPAACVAMCPYIDGHWAVNYMRGQVSCDWWSCSAEL